jgi:hypothetical protein
VNYKSLSNQICVFITVGRSRIWHHVNKLAPVQIASLTEMFPIDMDTLSIEQDSIPDGGRSGIFEPEHGEVELPLANAVH